MQFAFTFLVSDKIMNNHKELGTEVEISQI